MWRLIAILLTGIIPITRSQSAGDMAVRENKGASSYQCMLVFPSIQLEVPVFETMQAECHEPSTMKLVDEWAHDSGRWHDVREWFIAQKQENLSGAIVEFLRLLHCYSERMSMDNRQSGVKTALVAVIDVIPRLVGRIDYRERPEILMRLGAFAFHHGSLGLALRYFQEVVQENKWVEWHQEAFLGIGMIRFRTGDFENAKLALESAIAIEEDNSLALRAAYTLAWTYAELGRFDQFDKYIQTAGDIISRRYHYTNALPERAVIQIGGVIYLDKVRVSEARERCGVGDSRTPSGSSPSGGNQNP